MGCARIVAHHLCLLAGLITVMAGVPCLANNKPLGEQRPRYGKRALIVGINYTGRPPSDSLGELHRAEGDARAIYQLLLSNYGYNEENTRLLLGEEATKEAVESFLREGFLCQQDAPEPVDSVLFFFSGHGYLRKGADGKTDQGELLPYDVEFTGSVPNSAKTLDMQSIVSHLTVHCRARHKLVVLDCCHSGAIFERGFPLSGGRPVGPFEERLDRAVFQTPAFQAITASRKRQEASDGPPKKSTRGAAGEPLVDEEDPTAHSPFTYALKRSLETIPRRNGKQPVTASSLFRAMGVFLDDQLPKEQSPQCQWLSAEQGEFHFFPEGEFPDEAVPDERMRQMLIAMVPGVFGNWWFEETPWLMPSLRHEIVAHMELKRSTGELEVFSRDRLRAAADQARHALEQDYDDPLTKMRLKHLTQLVQLSETDRILAFQSIAADLQEAATANQAEAVDRHFLAVLLQALDQPRDEVDAAYNEALNAYRAECERHRRSLPQLALCHADYGWFLRQAMHRYEDSALNYRLARGVFAVGSPTPFQVFTLCRESEAYLELGRWQLADGRLAEAIRLAEQFDPDRVHPLTAATYSRRAWACMQQWRITEAEQRFTAANEVLAKYLQETPGDYEAIAAELHNHHGLAMASRFTGEAAAALAAYRRLSPNIAEHLHQHQTDAAGQDLNFAEVHHRLAERWVNTLERQGDCWLFGADPDYGEAADDYRRALVSCDELARHRQTEWRLKLLLKRAIALSLQGPTRDPELADVLRTTAASLLEDDQRTLAAMPASIRFQSKLAEALPELEGDEQTACPTKAADRLHDVIRAHVKSRGALRNIPRDELESLMFATRILLRHETDRGRVEETSELLLAFCRLARSSETLPFLRPYYDEVLRAKLRTGPNQVKDLIEIAWEATQGRSYRKLEGQKPVLALYTIGDECFLFLDAPRGPSKYYSLKEYADPATVVQASILGQRLPLPLELKRDVRSLPEAWRTQLAALDPECVRWHDPVIGLWSDRPTPTGEELAGRVVVYKPVVEGSEDAGADIAERTFPFDLSEFGPPAPRIPNTVSASPRNDSPHQP